MITGDRSVEIDAPIDRCFDIAADIEGAPKWQGSLKDVEVLSKDADGRAEVVEHEVRREGQDRQDEAALQLHRADADRVGAGEGRRQVAARGWWDLEDLGGGRTRATYALEVDPGRMLGMLLRGPVEGTVKDFLLGGAADGLKQEAESSA